MDDGTFGYVLSSFGFNVETDVAINGCFAPFWLLWTHYLNLAAWLDRRWVWWCYSQASSVVASEEFSRRNFIVEWFVWSVAISAPSGQFLVPRLENSDSARFNSLFFNEVLIEDSNGRWDINSFVLSFVWFTVEAVVEAGESSARVWPFWTRSWGLSAWLI